VYHSLVGYAEYLDCRVKPDNDNEKKTTSSFA
jgi:hypothetical protein